MPKHEGKSAKKKKVGTGKAGMAAEETTRTQAVPPGIAIESGKLGRKAYEKELKQLHVELVKLQQWVVHKGLKVCIVFEGRDGAGKGGTIKALTERVSPRIFRVVALPAPTDREKSQMYLQRFVPYFPAAGEIMIFDRSWYNRAGVERAMVDSGIILLKYWLEVSPEEQRRRLVSRVDDGRKIWKLSPMDLKSYNRWDDYTRARDEMFAATDSSWAPWFVANSEDKKRARLNVISHILDHVPYEELPREKVALGRRKIGRYQAVDYPFRYVAERF